MLTLFSALRKQQAEFVSQVAFSGHFLKTPFQSALFALRRLGELGSSEEDRNVRQCLVQRIEQQILMALFDASVLQTANKEMRTVFDVHPLIVDLCRTFEPIGASRGVSLAVPERPGFPCRIRAIQSQVRVALSNLLDNAVKYSYSAKTVRIRLTQPEPKQLLLEIEDLGEGFSPGDHDRLFHVGERVGSSESRVRHGTGLGLAQAKHFLEEFGGSINIESEPQSIGQRSGSGPHLTVVQVLLPAVN
jgi:two-component system phosphate regulon sensor histidine kinase PhoR